MADNQETEPILLHEDTHKKDLISAHPINQGD